MYRILVTIIILVTTSSCASIKPNWSDSIKNPKNKVYKSQMDYMQKNYEVLGDSSITWYYKKIDKHL